MRQAPRLTPDLLLKAYALGVFPMARGREDSEIRFYSPEQRGILPLDRFHVPRRLARTVRHDAFTIRIDCAFEDVIRSCAAAAPGRSDTWINDEIVGLYTALHRRGRAHSVECWRNGELAGGLYGVAIGGAFFGESMFSRERDASKVALVHLAARLRAGRYSLLDAQFLTEHLSQFGAVAIAREQYMDGLTVALEQHGDFFPAVYCPDPSGNSGSGSLDAESGEVGLTRAVDATTGATWPGWFVLQLITQTS